MKANDLKDEAERLKRAAISGRKDADDARKAAETARFESARHAKNAERATNLAESKAKEAKIAQASALAAQRRAHTLYLISQSVGLLASDPERSAAFAVDAADASASSGDRLKAENALRAALVAIRVQHILPGVGTDGARVARFSSDARRAGVAVGG